MTQSNEVQVAVELIGALRQHRDRALKSESVRVPVVLDHQQIKINSLAEQGL